MATSIFFSHSSRDRQWCEWLAAEAAKVGVEAYLAEHDPRPGTLLADKVKRAIDGCHAFVVLLTRNTADSSYVHQEVGYALAQRKLVIPLVQPTAGAQQLSLLQGIEYIEFDFEDPHAGRESFAAELRRVAEKQRKQNELETLIAIGACVALIVLLLSQGGPGVQAG